VRYAISAVENLSNRKERKDRKERTTQKTLPLNSNAPLPPNYLLTAKFFGLSR
jgi:hypothetical protein